MTTRAPSLTYQRPWLYPAQAAALFCAERYGVVEASTKSGKTAGCMVWLAEQALLGRAGRNYWWIAPVYAQARIVYRRLKRGLPRALYAPSDTELTLSLANGAVLWFKSAEHPDALYGEDVYAAVIDEASRVREDAWHAVRSTLTATRGPVRIIGNVKGHRNWAYRLAREAAAGAPDMHYARITAADAVAAGVLTADEVADARRLLPEQVYRELYEALPADDGTNPFGDEHLRRCTVTELAAGPPVALGIDLAKSGDWTVVIGVNDAGAVCLFERWQGPWELTYARIKALASTTPGYIDATGAGDPVVERLLPGTGLEGFVFSQPSKQQLMESLAVAIQRHEIAFPDGPIAAELALFEYAYTRTGVRYAAPAGAHDDCVCALALAVLSWTRRPAAFAVLAGGERNLAPVPVAGRRFAGVR